jgi:hypothetical protein
VYLATSVLLGALRGLLLIAQAWLLASIITGAFIGGKDLAGLRVPMGRLLVVIVLRALVAWAAEVSAHRCSARVKSKMRSALVEQMARLGTAGDEERVNGGGRAGRYGGGTASGQPGGGARTQPGGGARTQPGGGIGTGRSGRTGDLAALTTRGVDASMDTSPATCRNCYWP